MNLTEKEQKAAPQPSALFVYTKLHLKDNAAALRQAQCPRSAGVLLTRDLQVIG
jgi:hypothetical protein